MHHLQYTQDQIEEWKFCINKIMYNEIQVINEMDVHKTV